MDWDQNVERKDGKNLTIDVKRRDVRVAAVGTSGAPLKARGYL